MKYPLGKMADQLESHGRFGDSTLVHLNPAEVAGLASLSPTGKLTTNPVTGRKEAFLPMLIPIIASYGGSALAASAGASAIGAAIAGGAASGLATYGMTGDADQALASGVMGMGVGAATAGASAAAQTAAEQVAAETAAQTALTEGATKALDPSLIAGTNSFVGPPAPVAAGMGPVPPAGYDPSAIANGPIGPKPPAGYNPPPGALADPTGMMQPDPNLAPPIQVPNERFAGIKGVLKSDRAPFQGTFGEKMALPMQAPEGQGMMSQFMKPASMLPIAMGGGQMMEMQQQNDLNAEGKRLEEEKEKKRRQAYLDLQGAYGRAQPNTMTGLSPFRSGMSANTPLPMFYGASGGITRLARGGKTEDEDYRRHTPYYGTFSGSAWSPEYSASGAETGYQGIDPVSIQAGLRGQYSVAPPQGYRAGFQPEFNYFQNDPENVQVPEYLPPQPYSPQINRFMAKQPANGMRKDVPYFESMIPKPKSKEKNKTQGMAGGGDVTLNTPLGEMDVAEGGIANVPNQYTEQPGQPTEQDVTMLASALMGENQHAEKIIEAFISQYGVEVFRAMREQILQMIQPGAQTEGLIQGPGGGMDDKVLGTIGADQPVAVSPGEYIVPADVVSGLGDGSSEAGAKELDMMSNNLRMARGGTTNQPPALDARRYMPA